MKQKEGLNLLDFLATGINKDCPIIQAVLSNENGEGATANEVNELAEFINYYTRTNNVRNHKGRTLDMIVQLFAKLRRRVSESDSVLLRRLLALTERQGDTIWGNGLNLKHVFETYFQGITCYVAENTNEENIMLDSNLSDEEIWQLDGGAAYSYEPRFSDMRGLLFNGAGQSMKQTVTRLFHAGIFTFHFMLQGKCGVIIQDAYGKYWNGNEQEFSGDTVLEWVDDEHINIFESPIDWENMCCVIKLPEDMRELTFKFVSIEGETAFIDYVRLFQKPLNPSYTLILQYTGYKITDLALHIGKDGGEPIDGVDYSRESYFDTAFIIGPFGATQSQSFNSVLDRVKPRGIQAFAEFVEKKEGDGL